MTIRIDIPLQTVSLLNRRDCWQVTAKRKKHQRKVVGLYMRRFKPPAPPVVVTLTRLSAGTLDAHDNLPSAFKHVVDALAQWLGIDDGDPSVRWIYAQQKAKPHTHQIIVEINQGTNA
jgi:hypothetical protein